MEQNSKPGEFNDPYFEEVQAKTKLTFDFILWFYRILKYWYLFVISVALFMGYAYIKNKSWTPNFSTTAVLMMEPRGNIGVAAGSVQYSGLIKNSINQQMILNSYDMIVRTMNKLPQMRVDYFLRTKFKTENLYGNTPVSIECQYVAPSAYAIVFEIEPINAEKCRIFYEGTEETPPFSMEVPYGQFVQESRFYIKVSKTERFAPNFHPFSFRFVSKEELISRYYGRVRSSLIDEGSSALRLSISGENPFQDIDFLNALLKEFEDYNLALKNEAADRTISFIDKQLLIISDSLSSAEASFNSFQERTGIYKVESLNNREMLDQSIKSLSALKAKEATVLVLTEEINNAIKNDKELIDPSTFGFTDESLSKGIAEYNNLVKSMRNMGKSNPLLERSERTKVNAKIKILEALRSIQEQLQYEKESLQNETRTFEEQLTTLPAKEREFLRYERNYKVNEAYHTYLFQKKYEANIEKASNVPDNYILEEPRLVGGPTNTNEKTETYLFSFIISLVLPLVFVVAKEELFNFAIATKEDCERISGLPVIGAIENIAKKMSGGSVLVKNFPKSSFAESFRNIRIRIEYMAQKESGITLLVTSAEPGDGKTFIAGNVASIYQLTGKKVVLLDFDLRRPSVAKLLGIQNKKGVSNFLIGQVTLDEITLTHPDYEFDVITAGTLPPNPSELIKTKKTKDLISYLNSKYDYVIIDCSPVGLVSDAYILSKLVDTTLFVVRRGKTNRSFFKSVVNQIVNDGIDHVALIFNDVKGREGYYGTSRYYGDKSYYLKKNSYYHDDYFEK